MPLNQLPELGPGVCVLLFAFDVSRSIDLAQAAQSISRLGIPGARPRDFEFNRTPLRVRLECAPLSCGDAESRSHADLTIFDFGSISVRFEIPIASPLEALAMTGHEPSLSGQAQRAAAALVARSCAALGPALRAASTSPIVEEYTIYNWRTPDGVEAEAFALAHAASFAGLLRRELGPLAREEIEDAMSARVSYSPRDIAVIDWNATVLLADEPGDTAVVLEYANLELMELRYLDDRLDADLDLAYDLTTRARARVPLFSRQRTEAMRRIGRLEVDSAVLFEEVNNALKLLGDQHLARVYRAASRRFHLAEWDASISRKLRTLDRIHDRLSQEHSTRRGEALEWIIIALIAFEVVMSFVR